MDNADRLGRIESLVEKNAEAIQALQKKSAEWDERFYQLTRDTLGTAKIIILTAGAVIILSPVLQAIAPEIGELAKSLIP